MNNKILFLVFLCLLIAANEANAFCSGCDKDHFMDELIKLESGNDYNAESGVLPEGSVHAGATAMGRYQIMHREAINWGCIPTRTPGTGSGTVLTREEINSFKSDTARQDACFEAGIAEKYSILEANGLQNGGGGYDCGALLGTAWLGDPVKVSNGGCTADALSKTYTTCDRAEQMQGVCAGGAASETDKEYPGRAAMIGCDPTIYDKNKTRVKALRQQESEAARKLITKPVSVQQLSCFDQYAKTNAEQIGSIRSNPGGNISASINPIVKDPALLNLAANFTGGNIPGLGEVQNVLNGGLQSMMNNALGGLTGGLFGAPGGAQGCNAMDEMFKLMECMDFPEMPSLPDILGGGSMDGLDQASQIIGALGTLGSGQGGGGVMGAICQAVKGSFGGGGSGGTDVFENLFNDLGQ